MLLRRCLPLVLLAACGDDVVADVTATASTTGGPGTGDPLSAGQTSVPTDATGDPTDPTSTSTTTSTSATTATDPSSTASTTGSPLDCSEITLLDPVLMALARAELDVPAGPIPGELAPNLEKIALLNGAFTTLAGLECFPNLKFLRLGGGTITDLAPLAGLHALEFLDLRDQQIVDLSPLAGLPELHDVRVEDNLVTDLSPLATLPKLDTLVVSGNPITSFEQLAGLALVELWANRTTPADLDGLGDLKQLQMLFIDDAGLTDIGPLAGATALDTLIIRDNAISDLTPLAALTNLEELNLSINAIVDVAPIGDLPALKILSLGDNMIFDPAPLAGLSALDTLYIPDNPLKPDLGALLALGALRYLDVSRTDREVLQPFAPQTLLKFVAAGNEVVDLNPLAGHAVLGEIVLHDNAITTLEPLLGAPFWGQMCVSLVVTGNPLGADAQDKQIPLLCEQSQRIVWDQGSCDGCPPP